MNNRMKMIAAALLVAVVCEVASATLGDKLRGGCFDCFKGSPTADEHNNQQSKETVDSLVVTPYHDQNDGHAEGERKYEKKRGLAETAMEKSEDKEFREKAAERLKKMLEIAEKEGRYDAEYVERYRSEREWNDDHRERYEKDEGGYKRKEYKDKADRHSKTEGLDQSKAMLNLFAY